VGETGMPPRIGWREWKARVSIAQVLEDIGWRRECRVVGTRLVGPCPLHGGDNRHAFTVQTVRNLWFCFTRCQAGGDVIDLVWRLSGHSWTRTADWLERLAVLSPAPRDPTRDREAPARRHAAFRPYTRRLDLDPTHAFFRRLALREDTLRRFEAGAWHGRGFLEGTVAVRLHDLRGNPLGYAGRRLDPEAVRRWGKWKWPPGYPKARGLWNWHRVDPDRADGLIVVEGPWSVMKLLQAGFTNAVALGGVGVSPVQAGLLQRAPSLTLMLDGDEAGERASGRHVADAIHRHMHVVRPPQGLDPADLTQTQLVELLERS
jgi:DNA primase